MPRSYKVLGFLLVAVLGVYGCARTPGGSSGNKAAALEAKVQRLEEDFKAAAAARDAFRQKLVAAEEQQGNLRRQFDEQRAAAARERDAIQAQLTTRTAERDHLQTHFDTFRKSLKDLLGQTEAALNTPPGSTASTLAGAHPTPADDTEAPN
jgi:chromosome segregation ATPase